MPPAPSSSSSNSSSSSMGKVTIVFLIFIIVIFLLRVSYSQTSSPSSSGPLTAVLSNDVNTDDNKEKVSTKEQDDEHDEPQQGEINNKVNDRTEQNMADSPIATMNPLAAERYERLSKTSYSLSSHKTKLTSADYFAGISFISTDDDDSSISSSSKSSYSEVFVNSRGFAEVNWSIALNCADRVIKKYFNNNNNSPSNLLAFPTFDPKITDENPKLSTGGYYSNFVMKNLHSVRKKAHNPQNHNKGDFGVSLRAIGFCLKGGGAEDWFFTTSEGWSKRGGGKMFHPYVAALHGGVPPLRAIGQGFRSAQYLGVVPHAIPNDHLFSRKIQLSESEIKSSYDILSQNTLEEIRSKKLMKTNSNNNNKKKNPFVIVDLGGGHGTLLSAMCPPSPNLWCYGVDLAEKLIQQGSHFFPHLDLRAGVSAPHIPSGSVDAVLSNGVMGIIKFVYNCVHVREMLRLLRPGKGIAQVWQTSMFLFAHVYPSFFVADEDTFLQEDEKNPTRSFIPDWDGNEIPIDPKNRNGNNNNNQTTTARRKVHFSKFFPTCPGNLGQYISRIDIIADDPHLPIYAPQITKSSVKQCIERCQTGCFGVRIFRNKKKYPEDDRGTNLYFEPDFDHGEKKNVSFAPPDSYAKSLKAPKGLVDTCLSSAEKWKKCQEFDEFSMTKMYECNDRLVKNPATKARAWCPKEHVQIMEKRNDLWRDDESEYKK